MNDLRSRFIRAHPRVYLLIVDACRWGIHNRRKVSVNLQRLLGRICGALGCKKHEDFLSVTTNPSRCSEHVFSDPVSALIHAEDSVRFAVTQPQIPYVALVYRRTKCGWFTVCEHLKTFTSF